MSKVSSRWVPRMLTNDQKSTLIDNCRYLLFCYEDDPCDFIERFVTQDATCAHHFDFDCLFDLIFYVPSTTFQFNRDGSFWVEPVLS